MEPHWSADSNNWNLIEKYAEAAVNGTEDESTLEEWFAELESIGMSEEEIKYEVEAYRTFPSRKHAAVTQQGSSPKRPRVENSSGTTAVARSSDSSPSESKSKDGASKSSKENSSSSSDDDSNDEEPPKTNRAQIQQSPVVAKAVISQDHDDGSDEEDDTEGTSDSSSSGGSSGSSSSESESGGSSGDSSSDSESSDSSGSSSSESEDDEVISSPHASQGSNDSSSTSDSSGKEHPATKNAQAKQVKGTVKHKIVNQVPKIDGTIATGQAKSLEETPKEDANSDDASRSSRTTLSPDNAKEIAKTAAVALTNSSPKKSGKNTEKKQNGVKKKASPNQPGKTPPRRRRKVASKSVIFNTVSGGWSGSQAVAASEDAESPSTDTGEVKAATAPTKPSTKKPSKDTEKKQAAMKGTPKAKTATKKESPTKKKSTPSGRQVPREIWLGVPDEEIEGGWPAGWIKKTFERVGGKTKKAKKHDSYWFSPIKQKKLRSMNEVKRFLAALKTTNGDEEAAWNTFKKKAT